MPSLLMPLANPALAGAGADVPAPSRAAGADAGAPGAFAQALRQSSDNLRPSEPAARPGPAPSAGTAAGGRAASAPAGPDSDHSATRADTPAEPGRGGTPAAADSADPGAVDDADDSPRSRGRAGLRRGEQRRQAMASLRTDGDAAATGTGTAVGGTLPGSDPSGSAGLADGTAPDDHLASEAGTAAAGLPPAGQQIAGMPSAPETGPALAPMTSGTEPGPGADAGAGDAGSGGLPGLTRDARPTARRWPMAGDDSGRTASRGAPDSTDRPAREPALAGTPGVGSAAPVPPGRAAPPGRGDGAAGAPGAVAGTAGAAADDARRTVAGPVEGDGAPSAAPADGAHRNSGAAAPADAAIPTSGPVPTIDPASPAHDLRPPPMAVAATGTAVTDAALAGQAALGPGAGNGATGLRRPLSADANGLADPARRMTARPSAGFTSPEAGDAVGGARRGATRPGAATSGDAADLPAAGPAGRSPADRTVPAAAGERSAGGDGSADGRASGDRRGGPGARGEAASGLASLSQATSPHPGQAGSGGAGLAAPGGTESFQALLGPALAQAGGQAPGAPAVPTGAPAPTLHLPAPLHGPGFPPALGAQVSWLARAGVHEARIELNPAEMGPVSVRIVVQGGGAQIDFQAEQAATRQVIESSLPVLAGALRDAGLTLTGGGVFEARSAPAGNYAGQSTAGGQAGQGGQGGHGGSTGPDGHAGQRGTGLPGDGTGRETEAFERSATPVRQLLSQRGLVDLVA